jgi:hypothetical protein
MGTEIDRIDEFEDMPMSLSDMPSSILPVRGFAAKKKVARQTPVSNPA